MKVLYRVVLLIVAMVMAGCVERQSGGEVAAPVVAQVAIDERAQRQVAVQPQARNQVLFGDLHVHTTFSPDAFITAHPVIVPCYGSMRSVMRLMAAVCAASSMPLATA